MNTLAEALKFNLLTLGINPETKERTVTTPEIEALARPIVRVIPHRDSDQLMNLKAAIETTIEIAYKRGRNQSLADTLSNPVVRNTIRKALDETVYSGEVMDPEKVINAITLAVTSSGSVQ